MFLGKYLIVSSIERRKTLSEVLFPPLTLKSELPVFSFVTVLTADFSDDENAFEQKSSLSQLRISLFSHVTCLTEE